MRTYESLFGWADHDLIGHPAREILGLAERHGRPHASTGMPLEIPVPFELPDLNKLVDRPDAYMSAVQLEEAIRVLYGAVDYHWFPHRQIFATTRPFEVLPAWATPEHGLVIDPNWLPFQREALEVVQRFVDELASRGLVRYVAREVGSLKA
ncbi:hypothetical protein [Pseudomonas oryzae]|uniref:Uncharacterized protein n=1 Tax=Pseudomonas oryzae TaxID=1392877 RepID=A0A1H1MWC0_9PSED|nr:hypothetical protein [Pseudomonas oryzae]SDR90755.1 hypothetical protein SAMN05216221_0625 [Pseudomonas oryzae]